MAKILYDDFYYSGSNNITLQSYNSNWKPYHTGSASTITVVNTGSYARCSGPPDDAAYAYASGTPGKYETYSSLIMEATVRVQSYLNPDRQQCTLVMGTNAGFVSSYGAGYAFGVAPSNTDGEGCVKFTMYRMPTSLVVWPILTSVNVPVPGYPKDYKLRFYNIGNLLIGEGYVLNEPTTYRKLSAVDATYSKSAMLPGIHIWMSDGVGSTESPIFYDWSVYNSSNPRAMVIRNAKVENATFKIR